MQVSADYYGINGVAEYFAMRDTGGPQLQSNVGHNREAIEAAQRSYTMRTCHGCGRRFVISRKQDGRAFHSDTCHAKATERNAAKGVIPNGWKPCAVCNGPFLPEHGTERYCKRTACSRGSVRQSARDGNRQAA